jgi:hypothetical protein
MTDRLGICRRPSINKGKEIAAAAAAGIMTAQPSTFGMLSHLGRFMVHPLNLPQWLLDDAGPTLNDITNATSNAAKD